MARLVFMLVALCYCRAWAFVGLQASFVARTRSRVSIYRPVLDLHSSCAADERGTQSAPASQPECAFYMQDMSVSTGEMSLRLECQQGDCMYA